MPAYNHELYVEEAINSVLNQIYPNIELIIIDDKSQDKTPQIIQEIAEKNPKKIQFLNHITNKNTPFTFNHALTLAKGYFIAPFASDDIMPSTGIYDRVMHMLQNPDIDILLTDFKVIDSRCEIYEGENKYNIVPQFSRFRDFDPNCVYEQLINGNFLPGGASLIRLERVVLEDIMQDIRVPNLSDYDMWMNLAEKGFRWSYLDKSTWVYRWNEKNLSKPSPENIKKSIKERIYILSKKLLHGSINYHSLIIRSINISCKVLEQITSDITASEKSLNYNEWYNRHRWSTTAIMRLASQISINTTVYVHVLLINNTDLNKYLTDTLKSLDKQLLNNWRLTVLSSTGHPDLLFEKQPFLSWINLTETNLANALNAVVENSDSSWFLIGIPGLHIEPVFIALIYAEVSHHPEWRFIYLDEDCINSHGHFADPMLKPDANYDLLLSTCYIGNACLIHRELLDLLPTEVLSRPGLILNYAAALRCYEAFGEQAIGHIDEIGFHQPKNVSEQLEQFESFGLKILREHLQRRGIAAEVNLGLIKGSFFVNYSLTHSPPVSIIIPTKDRLDLLQPCVESLLKKTRYSNYEVLIVNNCSTDPATLEYLTQLPNRHQRIRIIPYSHEYNYSTINNYAARQAKGDFLLLLNNDTIVLQENWLERMISIGLRNDVGIVGCRLVYTDQKIQHAGVILGLCGIAEHIGIGSRMGEPGYLGRAQLTQNFSAVTAACLLVRKDLFFKVEGLDEKDFAILYNDIDLCLKIAEHGYRIVWTPFVTLVHHGNSSLNTETDPKRNERNLRSRNAFIKKWRSRLGNDPAYNRHLSLRQREWMIDGDFDVPWHPDLEPLPRIVAQPPDEMGVGQYRMIGPLKELTDSGRICSFLLPALTSDKRFLPYVSELIRAKPTVFFLQNAFSDFHLDDLQHYAELLPDLFRVFGQDDIVFSIPQKSAARKHFGKDTKARVRKAVALCHRAIVTTAPIAEALRGMVDDIRVMPNYLERSRWGDLQPPRNERRKLRVGWAGAQQHQGDLEFILPVVEATANEVDWIFMGMCPPKLRYHVAEAHNAVPFDQYPAALAALDLDLAIAPLELNRFNTAKSNLRLLEYGAVGYPVIATDILPYRNAPVTRVPNNPQAWIDAIRAHVHDLDATRAAGEQLREWVLSDWMLDQHLDEWLKALLPD